MATSFSGSQANLGELGKQKYIIASFTCVKQNKFLVWALNLKTIRYLFLLQSQSICTGTFLSQYVLHTLPCSLLILNRFFSFSFQLLFYLSINPLFHRSKHCFQSFLPFLPRWKEVVVLIIFTAVRGDRTLMALIKLFTYSPMLVIPHIVFCCVKTYALQ